jgi:hypothetical protein
MEKGGAKANGYSAMSSTLGRMSGREGDSAKNFDLTGEMQVSTSKDVQRRAQTHLTEKGKNGLPAKGAKSAVDVKTIDNYIKKTKEATKADKSYATGKKNLEKTTKKTSKELKRLTNTTQSVT